MRTTSKFLKSAAIFSMLGLTLAACADDNGDEPDDDADVEDTDTDDTDTDAEEDDDAEADGDGGTITLGYIEGWTDGSSLTFLWQHILEEQGYDVEIEALGDAAPVYQGLADGDIDVYPSAWLPATHESYMDQHGDELEDLGAYYEGAVLTLAVPEYTDIDSIPELLDDPAAFDNQIVGIEAGAGHMETTEGTVMPEYGLDAEFDLIESSTAAMLSELDNAISNEEDIVVTLWRPFWAYGSWDLKDLEDPEGHFGEEETLNLVANSEFSSQFPEVAEWMSNFELTDDEYAELEDLVVNEYDDGPEGAVEWAENNQDLIDELIGE
ncbi:glycine betaine ABC transporter substrate-binding protein [Nesterenkonia alba]|uniref:glycine betaine ABC transporter substrate-binding protein n=1 Tax=Nesterenkonia alba TaxID=515814 RepID=UPI0003B409DA|nr:glycine betaine ABC transporter substrate-binding protein [Nesterenkonia alba]